MGTDGVRGAEDVLLYISRNTEIQEQLNKTSARSPQCFGLVCSQVMSWKLGKFLEYVANTCLCLLHICHWGHVLGYCLTLEVAKWCDMRVLIFSSCSCTQPALHVDMMSCGSFFLIKTSSKISGGMAWQCLQALPSRDFPVTGGIHSWVRWGFEQSGLVQDVPAHGRGAGLDGLYGHLPTQSILWSNLNVYSVGVNTEYIWLGPSFDQWRRDVFRV